MRIPVSLCAAALIGAVAMFSPNQARADVTIIIQTDDRNVAAPYGRGKVYVAPNGRAKAYVAPNRRAPVYYGAPNGRAPVHYGGPNGDRSVYYDPNRREEIYVAPYGREETYVAPYGQQNVYVGPGGPAQYYGARAPVVVYDDRPPPWSPGWYAYCTSKYRSFDPATGTFQPYHGPRQLCR
jgi:hypothetical protein